MLLNPLWTKWPIEPAWTYLRPGVRSVKLGIDTKTLKKGLQIYREILQKNSIYPNYISKLDPVTT